MHVSRHPIQPIRPFLSGSDHPSAQPRRGGLLRSVLAVALCVPLALAAVFLLDALGVTPPTVPCGEDTAAACAAP